MNKFLIIQTAFIGDVILATPILEAIHAEYPHAQITIVVKSGNEKLFVNHPYLFDIIKFNKKQNKILNLFLLIKHLRKTKFDYVINLHRFFTSGLITALIKGTVKIGFDKNPLSLFYSIKKPHIINNINVHEIDRNLSLIKDIINIENAKIKLHPSVFDFNVTQRYKKKDYICIAPTSVWFTKQFPIQKWMEFINAIDPKYTIFLVGAKPDKDVCDIIKRESKNKHIINLAGTLEFLETAALFQDAHMNYVNDSAPLHIASAVNAPVTAIFCSTIPAFGFGPLSDKHYIIQTPTDLYCKPCGLHGFKHCPEKHFKCANTIDIKQLLATLE